MIPRLGRYLQGSWPPAFYLPYALLWATGLSALFARADHRIGLWRPTAGTAAAMAAFVITVLLMRVVDDLRDLEYDLVHNPGRPLPSGAVRSTDLMLLLAAGSAAALALSAAASIPATGVLAVLLAYAAALLSTGRFALRPAPDRVVLGALLGLPVQLLLDLYLYAVLLDQAGLRPDGQLVLPLLTAVAAFLHVEFARKTTRAARPGEHNYSTRYGPDATAVRAALAALAAVLLGLTTLRVWDGHGWAWLLVLPAVLPAHGAHRFWRRRSVRWPAGSAALFLLADFTVYLLLGLLGKDT